MAYKLGSLFDGSGGFPLSGALCGIEPRWASEVEPYPIAVTRERFPNMKHLGDISKINGADIEPVDIITFGSPCQDLSVAGKRAGLKHEANGDEETTRSGLFMEAVRIIKEMRTATNGQYPRFALWENVPGAFSSNKGEDFRIVCEELIKIVEPAASMPSVPKGGWAYADSYVGDGWSLAYRVFDAQYWGVPQRRRRIHLVADFRGERAREVLFERQGVRGYFETGRTPWQTTPAHAEGGAGADDREGNSAGEERDLGGGGLPDRGRTAAGGRGLLTPSNPGYPNGLLGDGGLDAIGFDSYNQAVTGDRAMSIRCKGDNESTPCVAYTLKIRSGCEGGGKGALVQEDKSATLATNNDQYLSQPVPTHDQATRFSGKRGDKSDGKGNGLGVGEPGDPMNTLTSGDRHAVVYAFDRAAFNQGQNAKYDFEITDSGINSTLVARGPSGVAYSMQGFGDYKESEQASACKARDYKDATDLVVRQTPIRYIVRRLTPTECARLQGFADWWSYIEPKTTLTEEEYRFWCDVYLTKQIIDGGVVYNEDGELVYKNRRTPYKPKTEKQRLTWYNKLYTDSAEYKMWGNGIALPPALYCMQGIIDALNTEEDLDEWML